MVVLFSLWCDFGSFLVVALWTPFYVAFGDFQLSLYKICSEYILYILVTQCWLLDTWLLKFSFVVLKICISYFIHDFFFALRTELFLMPKGLLDKIHGHMYCTKCKFLFSSDEIKFMLFSQGNTHTHPHLMAHVLWIAMFVYFHQNLVKIIEKAYTSKCSLHLRNKVINSLYVTFRRVKMSQRYLN